MATTAVVKNLLKAALALPEAETRGASPEERAAATVLLDGALQDAARDKALARVQALLDRTWERLNTGHWSAVPLERRRLYALASLHKVWLLLAKQASEEEVGDRLEASTAMLREALAAADQGLLLGAPLLVAKDNPEGEGEQREDALAAAAAALTRALRAVAEEKGRAAGPGGGVAQARVSSDDKSKVEEDFPPSTSVPALPVPSLQMPSLEYFSREHFTPQLPVLLLGAAEHWPARRRWVDLEYLRRVAGARTVPVELGAHYADPEWAQRLMTIDDFVTNHVQPPPSSSGGSSSSRPTVGYLAQHPLFEQVPELRLDICIPEYCCLSDDPEGATDPDINAWFGPAGTVSPLHFDPKHNLLTQVVGSKHIFLYAPKESPCLYPHEGTLLSNTSQVDPELPDYEKFPALKEAQAFKCTLRPGDALYIPPRWWHHVRSLSTSFSVSFWWQ